MKRALRVANPQHQPDPRCRFMYVPSDALLRVARQWVKAGGEGEEAIVLTGSRTLPASFTPRTRAPR